VKKGDTALWAVRISWPLLGGVWGAWLGARGYLALPHNADSFAMLFALGFFSLFALVGLVAGMTLGVLIGGLVERLLRHLGAQPLVALSVATLLNVLVCWQLTGVIQAQYPGLSHPVSRPPVSSAAKPPTRNACARPPPENPRERTLWDSECR
jgi:hypothetical protein